MNDLVSGNSSWTTPKVEEVDSSVARLVPTRSAAEIAADLKRRFEEAVKPALAVMDEARRCDLMIAFDGVMLLAPALRAHGVVGLRVVKHY